MFRTGDPFERCNNYDDIRKMIKDLAKSSSVKISSIGKTVQGREIPVIKIDTSPKRKKVVMLECGVHAREWISTATCVNFARNMIRRLKLMSFIT